MNDSTMVARLQKARADAARKQREKTTHPAAALQREHDESEELLTYEHEKDCVCAHCGHPRLTVGRVEVYVKGYAENDPGLHVVIDIPHTNVTVSGDASTSVFAQGEGAVITLRCRKCSQPTGILIGSARGHATQVTRRHRFPGFRALL